MRDGAKGESEGHDATSAQSIRRFGARLLGTWRLAPGCTTAQASLSGRTRRGRWHTWEAAGRPRPPPLPKRAADTPVAPIAPQTPRSHGQKAWLGTRRCTLRRLPTRGSGRDTDRPSANSVHAHRARARRRPAHVPHRSCTAGPPPASRVSGAQAAQTIPATPRRQRVPRRSCAPTMATRPPGLRESEGLGQ